jgi:hypothetical protein
MMMITTHSLGSSHVADASPHHGSSFVLQVAERQPCSCGFCNACREDDIEDIHKVCAAINTDLSAPTTATSTVSAKVTPSTALLVLHLQGLLQATLIKLPPPPPPPPAAAAAVGSDSSICSWVGLGACNKQTIICSTLQQPAHLC